MILAELNAEQQREFWLACARDASQKFSLTDVSLTWLGYTHNAVFRIDTDTVRYVLRLGQYNDNLLATVQTQARWLARLPQRLAVQRPAFAKPEDSIRVLDDGETPILASLWQYIEGASLEANDLTPERMADIAHLLSAFHQTIISYEQSLPSLMYDGLFGQNGRYDIAADTFTPLQTQVITKALVHVHSVMDALSQQHDEAQPVLGMLHGDLLTKNIVIMSDGNLGAIDFEYSGWGFFLYDLTPLLWQLQSRADYHILADAYWQAYTTAMPHSVGTRAQLDMLIVARQVASLRWLALNQHNPAIHAQYPHWVKQRINELQRFLDTGIFRRS